VTQRWAAHEFLETQESLRNLVANIELHAHFVEVTEDHELKGVLTRHINRMMNTYQQGVNMLQSKGQQAPQLNIQVPRFNVMHQPTIGLQNPSVPAPNPHANRLSDVTISTIALNQHKAGSMLAMLWAGECADPHLRSYHVMIANNCQEMAYEIWQYMNHKGYYQAPQLASHTMNTMIQAFQNQPVAVTSPIM